jgi:hypothetical protein
MLVLYAGYDEFFWDCKIWLPAWSNVGHAALWQTLVLGTLALMIAGAAISTAYEFLCYVFD